MFLITFINSDYFLLPGSGGKFVCFGFRARYAIINRMLSLFLISRKNTLRKFAVGRVDILLLTIDFVSESLLVCNFSSSRALRNYVLCDHRSVCIVRPGVYVAV